MAIDSTSRISRRSTGGARGYFARRCRERKTEPQEYAVVSARIGPEILQKLERYLHLLNDRTPETQQADDHLAVGLLVQAVSESPHAADTLIIVTEDDCQDGPDDVDSPRATAYAVGPSPPDWH